MLFSKGAREAAYIKKTDGALEVRLVDLSCSEPPDGYSRWSLRLLADKVVEMGDIDNILHEAIRRIIKKQTHVLAEKKVGDPSRSKW